jgi:hypothetical protein
VHKHCSSEKVIPISYSDCVSLALVIQHAKRMRSIVICGLSGSAIFISSITQTARYSKKVMEHKRVLVLSASSLGNISHAMKYSARYYQCT